VNRDHFEIGMMLINHGKNVLIEKPLCLNKAQSTQLTKAAKDKKVFLMEVKLMFTKYYPRPLIL
jgi:dihydrodiol dehydrogenase / D-xylose 1-dehydrogenase (NADP)